MSDLTDIMEENMRLLHAVQSGVKATIDYGLTDSHSPKHLRTGLNNALCGQGALVELLIEKGIFTALEYETAYNKVLKREVQQYEFDLSAHLKKKVTLA